MSALETVREAPPVDKNLTNSSLYFGNDATYEMEIAYELSIGIETANLTLNGAMAIILRYFIEFGSFGAKCYGN